MNLFKAETGDGSLVFIIRSETKNQAIKMANARFEEEHDDGAGFSFCDEDVALIETSGPNEIIETFEQTDY